MELIKLNTILVILIITGLILSIIIGTSLHIQTVSEEEYEDYKLNAVPIVKRKNNVNIIVDPRLELLSVIQILSNYDERYNLITDYEFEYKNNIQEYFSEYKNHEAVKMFEKMSSKFFTYDAPISIILHMNNDFEFKDEVVVSDFLLKRAGGEKNALNFLTAVKKFSKDIKFDKFFVKNKKFYTSIIDNTILQLEEKDFVSELENYFGIKNKSYNIVLVPLFHHGGYGPRIKNKEGMYEVFSVIGPSGVSESIPFFGTKEFFKHLQRHEFGHSFVNPITAEHWDKAQKYKRLYNPIEKEMKKQAYVNWQTCLNEHIIRAITTRLAYIDGMEQGNRALKYEKEKGFIYVDAIIKKLEVYEHNRDRYTSFDLFYEELLRAFDDI